MKASATARKSVDDAAPTARVSTPRSSIRTTAGITELALVEWKFTESYLEARDRKAASDAVRIGRYGADLGAIDSPIVPDVLPIELLLDEPFYQLMRQQLLARRLEQDRALGAESFECSTC